MIKNHYRTLIGVLVMVFMISLLIFVPAGLDYWTQFVWMLPVAFLIALTVNTLGISGAALFVPFFILIFPFFAETMSAAQSVRVGLITESFGLTSSAIAFLVFGLVDKKLAFYSALGAIPFVVGGALVTALIPQSTLYFLIAILLIVAIMMVYYKRIISERRLDEVRGSMIDYASDEGEKVVVTTVDKKEYSYCRTKLGYKKRFFGYGVGGFFQGAAGFGIGEVGIISMILTKIPTRIAIGTSHLVVAVTAIVASVMHVSLSHSAAEAIPWNLIMMTVPAVVIGGQLAPSLAAKLETDVLEKALITIFSVIALSLIILATGYSPAS